MDEFTHTPQTPSCHNLGQYIFILGHMHLIMKVLDGIKTPYIQSNGTKKEICKYCGILVPYRCKIIYKMLNINIYPSDIQEMI